MTQHHLVFTKSSRSGQNGHCVEVAGLRTENAEQLEAVAVRDSKQGESGPLLWATTEQWQSFLAAARSGFNHD